MAQAAINYQKLEEELQERITAFHDDPYGFVMFAYPWGEPGTLLEKETGPDVWQTKVLKDIAHGIKYGWVDNDGVKVDCSTGIRIAVRSGHGIGKTALMAWLDHWFMSTHPNPGMRTTANTKDQLTTTTWREMAKWHDLLINKHWFTWTATKFTMNARPATWFSPAIPQSENNAQAFAGLHEKFVLVKYDEASEIPDVIWEVSEGSMTDKDGLKIWIVFGNPTQNTGRFTECFKRFRHMWICYQVDARDSNRTDKELIQQWVDAYGEDSDFVRVRVKGMEPRAGILQFIPSDYVEAAAGRVIHISSYVNMPKILGVDCARFGDDQSAIITRQGLAAYNLKKYRNLDSITLAGYVAQEIKEQKPDAVFLDMGNIGAAVYDLLISWGHKQVTGVWFGAAPDDSSIYFNKRVEMWGRMKDWLRDGGCIPDDRELKDDLVGPMYGFTSKEQFQLEKKEDMKKRGVASPDPGDSLAVTFAYPVVKQVRQDFRRQQPQAITQYNPLHGIPSR